MSTLGGNISKWKQGYIKDACLASLSKVVYSRPRVNLKAVSWIYIPDLRIDGSGERECLVG